MQDTIAYTLILTFLYTVFRQYRRRFEENAHIIYLNIHMYVCVCVCGD